MARARKTHGKNTKKSKRSRSRKSMRRVRGKRCWSGGAQTVFPASTDNTSYESGLSSPSKMMLAQGNDYLSLHEGQHGGANSVNPAPAPPGYTGVLDGGLRDQAFVSPIDQSLKAIQGMSDMAGGRRTRKMRGGATSIPAGTTVCPEGCIPKPIGTPTAMAAPTAMATQTGRASAPRAMATAAPAGTGSSTGVSYMGMYYPPGYPRPPGVPGAPAAPTAMATAAPTAMATQMARASTPRAMATAAPASVPTQMTRAATPTAMATQTAKASPPPAAPPSYMSMMYRQRGGAVAINPAPAPVGDTGMLDSSLRAQAGITPIDQSLQSIQGMSDQSGGGRRRRKAKATRRGKRKNKASRRTRQRKMRGGSGYNLSNAQAVGAPGMLLSPGQEAKALESMNPEWKLATDPNSFAPSISK